VLILLPTAKITKVIAVKLIWLSKGLSHYTNIMLYVVHLFRPVILTGFSWFSKVPAGSFPDNNLNWVTTTSFLINFLLIV
jgi:hypothetical protein